MKKIFFRCDSSFNIGSGHVVRCLTLANFLKRKGFSSTFICKEIKGNLFNIILKNNHKLIVLPKNKNNQIAWDDDADKVIEKVEGLSSASDWIVVDHYHLNKDWEKKISSNFYKLFIIDDLCDRPHYGNILLNQNYLPGIRSRYRKILPSKTKILLGPKYALLSPDYKLARKFIKIKKKKLKRLIIFFGASDNKNQTIRCLNVLSKMNLKTLRLDVVIGLANRKKKIIQKIVKKMINTNLHIQIPSLCNLMKKADLYLGSGGTSTWERCCLGLPSLVISTADNQVRQNKYLFKKGVIQYLGSAETVSKEKITKALNKFFYKHDNRTMSKKALKITNGSGLELVSREFSN